MRVGGAPARGASASASAGGEDDASLSRLAAFVDAHATLGAFKEHGDALPGALRGALEAAYGLSVRALARRRGGGSAAVGAPGAPGVTLYTDGFDAEQLWMQVELLAAAIDKAARCAR